MRAPSVDTADALAHINAHVVMTVRVRHRWITRWRLRVGAVLFMFAGWVTGFQSTTVDIRHE